MSLPSFKLLRPRTLDEAVKYLLDHSRLMQILAGGTDLAFMCDMVIAAEEARIGFPATRANGTPPTHMWVYHLGPQWAKRMLMTGDCLSGADAARVGLVLDAVPTAGGGEGGRGFDPARMRAVLKRATEAQPDNESAHYSLMTAYRDSGDLEHAKSEKAILDRLTKPPDSEFTRFLQKLGEKPPQ